jgi:beta-galactosidase
MTLSRRSFLKTSGTCILGETIARQAVAVALVAKAEEPAHPTRLIYPLSKGWLWSRTVPANGHQRHFDDSGFEHITLPHSNVFVPWHNTDQTSYQFVSLYRRHFTLPPEPSHRRTFVDFEGVMTASKVYLNGVLLGEYFGGFTPFSFELTEHLNREGENILSVEVDSRELTEVPPFGYEVDYLTFGGIYREVSLRTTSASSIEALRVTCLDVLTPKPRVEVEVFLNSEADTKLDANPDTLEAEIFNAHGTVAKLRQRLSHSELSANRATLSIMALSGLRLWQLHDPVLYSMRVRLLASSKTMVDEQTTRFALRDARFTPGGFSLNGEILKLRGLNRHQTFPFAGSAMPARVQRRDAAILKYQLKCNIVRCSHYPPSHHFLDACDEYGLLVIDETPGWQHVGDSDLWRERYLDNIRRMIRRDWNHPSIILWSVRINESRDFHDLYSKGNDLAHKLDPSRQTTGVRYFQESELLEDVFSMNDFQFPLKAPSHPLYLNTEFVGAEFPIRPWDGNAEHEEHILRYVRIFNQLNSQSGYSGGLGWCGFDYQTHSDFGSGDHICYHGVMDIFREPKPAAGFFRSQCPPDEEAVLEPGFHFSMNDEPGGFKKGIISSNCEQIRAFIGRDDVWHHIIDLAPEHAEFPNLAYPPFFLTLPDGNDDWGDLRLDGYVKGAHVISKSLSGKGIDQAFEAVADDAELIADGSDATRVVFRVTDQYGAPRPLCFDPITLSLDGPAVLVGEPIAVLSGGRTAVWIRSTGQPGVATLTATHPHFGIRTLTFKITTGAALQPSTVANFI